MTNTSETFIEQFACHSQIAGTHPARSIGGAGNPARIQVMTREEFMSSEYDEKNRNKQNEPGQGGRDKSAGSREENPQGQTEREGEGQGSQGSRSSQKPGSSNPSERSGESENE